MSKVEIIQDLTPKRELRELSVGDWFVWQGVLYMKIEGLSQKNVVKIDGTLDWIDKSGRVIEVDLEISVTRS